MSDIASLQNLSVQLRQGAQKFSAAFQSLQQQGQRLDWSAQDLASGANAWAGQGSQNFTTAWNTYHQSTQKAATAMENTSQALTKLAQKIDDAVQQLQQQQAQQSATAIGMGVLTVGLVVLDVLQLGLDPVTDGLTVAAGSADATAIAGTEAAAGSAEVAAQGLVEVDAQIAGDLDEITSGIDNVADSGNIGADGGGAPGDITVDDGLSGDGGRTPGDSNGGGSSGNGGSSGGGEPPNSGKPPTDGEPSDNTGDGGGNGGFRRDITSTSELDPNLPSKLNDGGTIGSGGRSGGNRPLSGPPNSYITTSGGHTFIYDDQGQLIYDIDSSRVKMTIWDQAPDGRFFPRDFKLVGPIPPEYLNLLP